MKHFLSILASLFILVLLAATGFDGIQCHLLAEDLQGPSRNPGKVALNPGPKGVDPRALRAQFKEGASPSQAPKVKGLLAADLGEVTAGEYGAPGQATLERAIAAIGGSPRTLVLTPGSWTISDKFTFPANITVNLRRGAVLNITIPDVRIAALSRSNPCRVTWKGHGLTNGDKVYFSEIGQGGWTNLNGQIYGVNKINDDEFSIPVDTTNYASDFNASADQGVYCKVLDIRGPFEAGLSQAFTWTGSGAVALGRGSVKEVFPEWWSNGSQGAEVSINQAILASLVNSAPVRLLPKTYILKDHSVIIPGNANNITIEGYGATINGAAINGPILQVGDFNGENVVNSITISGLTIAGAGYDSQAHQKYPKQTGITLGNCSKIILRDLLIGKIANVGINGKKAATKNRYWNMVGFYNLKVTGCGSSGLVIGQLDENDTPIQPADDIQIYNCLFNVLCKGVDRGGFNSEYAGVVIRAYSINWYGGEIANVGYEENPARGGVIGLFTAQHHSGTLSGVHFERVGFDQEHSADMRVTGKGLAIMGTTHQGAHPRAAKTGIFLGGAQNITIISPTFVGGAKRRYDYGIYISNSHHCNVIGGLELDRGYPCNKSLVEITNNSTDCNVSPRGR